jgi:hypothetical protein
MNIEYRTRNVECRRKAPFGQINACGGGGTEPSAHLLSIFILFLSFFFLFSLRHSEFLVRYSIFPPQAVLFSSVVLKKA